MRKLIVAMFIVEREGLDVIVGSKVCGKVHAVELNHPQPLRVVIVRMRGSYGPAPGATDDHNISYD